MTDVGKYEFLLILISIVLVLEHVAHRFRLPPAAALILGGTALALLPGMPDISIDPDLVMFVFLPPLLMSSAWFTATREFHRNLGGILTLAVGITTFTTAAVGLAAHVMVPSLPLAACFAFGAIVAPPDSVAADAILERLSLPSRVTALLQGESLLNDAAGLVLLRFAVAATLTGIFHPLAAMGIFTMVAGGGVLIGIAAGIIGLHVIRRIRQTEMAITATILLAEAIYILAEHLEVSGVLANVTAGMVLGWHQHTDFSANLRLRAQSFWKILVFLLESLLFILIGLSLRGVLARVRTYSDPVHEIFIPVAVMLAVMIVSRFVWLYASDAIMTLAHRLWPSRFRAGSPRLSTIMGWAAMRGVVTLTGALSLPDSFPGRDIALICAFGSILVTVLVQGLTLGSLTRWLKINGDDELAVIAANENTGWVRIANAQLEAIREISHQPDGGEAHPRLLEQYTHRARMAGIYSQNHDEEHAKEIAHFEAVLHTIAAGRQEIIAMHRRGLIHDSTMRDMEAEMDMQEIIARTHLGDA